MPSDVTGVYWHPRQHPVAQSTLPLAGVRVLDRTDGWGELSTRLLGDLGADVIRVEPIGGSGSRSAAPVRNGLSLGWVFRNSGKRILELDAMGKEGRSAVDRLLIDADILVTPEPVDDDLLELFPRLVVLVITPYGLSGPYATRCATDAVIAATAGQAFKAGASDREPLPPPGRFCDHVASATAAFAALCGLRHRNAHGIRSVLDFSVNEAVAQMSDWSLPNGIARLTAGYPAEARRGSGPVYPVFPCNDGHVRLVVLSPRQWHAMREWLGEPEYLQDPELDGFIERLQLSEAVLNPLYRSFFAHRDMDAVCVEAQRRGIVCTPVYTADEVLACHHLQVRNSFVETEVAPGISAELHSGFFEIQGVRAGPRPPGQPPTSGGPRDSTETTPGTTAASESGAGPGPAALAGLRVLDFGHGAVGVEIGRVFAELGAEVIKVESRAYPDFIRLQTGRENTPSFTSSNRSKRSLGINAKLEGGLDLLLELVPQSDLVIENNATGVMDSLGLGFERLSGANPDIVMVSSQLMGSRGPWAAWRGYGPSTLGPSGILSLWDYADAADPTGGGTIFPDQFAGRLGAVAALAAILGKEAGTTSGVHVEVAQIECAIGAIGDLLAAESVEAGSVHPLGGAHETDAPWGVYPASGDDEWVVINCRDERDWSGLVKVSGGLLDACSHEAALGDSRATVDRQLATWTRTLDKFEVARRCQHEGVPAGPVLCAAELATDPHLVARGFPVEIDQPDLGPITLEGPAWHSQSMPAPIYRPAPTIGQHTVEVARDLLGLDGPTIEALLAAGVLESSDLYGISTKGAT